jgi:quercetin dioxygenase-like cupin family protein
MKALLKRIEDMDKNLEEIRKLSETVDLAHFVSSKDKDKQTVMLRFEKGECVLLHVAKTAEYAICEVTVTPEAEMEWHSHHELEIIVVLEGRMLIEYSDRTKHGLEKNDVLVIKPEQKHRAIYGAGKNWQLCVTIPACAEFPNAK